MWYNYYPEPEFLTLPMADFSLHAFFVYVMQVYINPNQEYLNICRYIFMANWNKSFTSFIFGVQESIIVCIIQLIREWVIQISFFECQFEFRLLGEQRWLYFWKIYIFILCFLYGVCSCSLLVWYYDLTVWVMSNK